ncbi:MAG: SIS domain-containing protein [Frankiaceae bacterium]
MPLHEDLLDDPACIEAGDAGGMLLALSSAAAQVRQATHTAEEVGLARVAEEGRPRAIVVSGVGTAALAGDALGALAGPTAPVPIVTVRGPDLPGWVGAADLVLAISHSGSTQATLAVFDEANRRGCRLITIGAPGSPLAERAVQARGIHVPVRRGATQRASFWSLTMPVLVAADHLRLAHVPASDIEAAADALAACSEQCRPSSESFVNPAKSAALALAGSVPLLWGTSPIAAVAAARFASQLADNAKYPAVTMPAYDAGHGQLPALDGAFGTRSSGEDDVGTLDSFFRDRVEDPLDATRLRLVLLRDVVEQQLIAARAQATLDIVAERGLPVTVMTAEGTSPLTRLAGLVGFGDYVSVYLALLLGIDPTPVPFAGDLADRILVT